LVISSALGCDGRSSGEEATCANPPTRVVNERQVDVPYQGPRLDATALVTDPAPRLVVQVTNNEPTVERVRLMFDGVTALDIDLPAGLSCGYGAPVFSIAYDRPSGPVEVQLDLQGATSTSTIDVPTSGTVWAVVDVQSKREWGDITVYDSQPVWG
jgi:hypothetical protein